MVGRTVDPPAGPRCFLVLTGLGLLERLPEEEWLRLRVGLGDLDRLVYDERKLNLAGLDARESERLDTELSSDIFLTASNCGPVRPLLVDDPRLPPFGGTTGTLGLSPGEV